MDEKRRSDGYKAAKHLIYGDAKTRAPAMVLSEALAEGDVVRARTEWRHALRDLLTIGLANGTAEDIGIEFRMAYRDVIGTEMEPKP